MTHKADDEQADEELLRERAQARTQSATTHQGRPVNTPMTRDTIPLIFLMGATNVGKTTFVDCARGYEPIGIVEVGKMMRAKYPPEYFKGSGAPAHTQTEAWAMLLEGMQIAADAGKWVVVIDGQPRNVEQTAWAIAMPNPKLFLHLWCPPDVRLERAQKRDAADLAKLELSLKRLQDDPRVLYDCLTMIELHCEETATYSTLTYTPFDALRRCALSVTGRRLRL